VTTETRLDALERAAWMLELAKSNADLLACQNYIMSGDNTPEAKFEVLSLQGGSVCTVLDEFGG
jgi:hypothetical protein